MSATWKTTLALVASAGLLAAAGVVNQRLSPFQSPGRALTTGIPAEAGTTNEALAKSSSGSPQVRPPLRNEPLFPQLEGEAVPSRFVPKGFAGASNDYLPSGGVATPLPSVHFVTVFLGGFRGLITDGLWIRGAMLQEQGRYLELIQIADWITALEPEFPQVWALQAWNMAYNISVLMPDDDSRWQWVLNGLHLLRDRAIPATGTAPAICLELGQLFLHKIAGGTDDHADLYRQRWIMRVMQVTGHNEPPGEDDRAGLQAALRMDPPRMRQIEQRYGNVDWRLPESQSLYWAFTGVSVSPAPNTAVLCRRMIYQSMATLFEGGALIAEPEAGAMVLGTAFDLLPGALRAFEEALPTDPVAAEAFAAFLRRAIRQLATFDRKAEAERCFEFLHQRFPDAETRAGFGAFTRYPRPIMPKIITIP